ncbi:hypothetical protein BGZ99_001906 [Dissophora globulifera]|uniref:Septin-type G domain-containing protein n=1 Tax=Dissophora globulifera TaxID=979702 RepID=A0A9P6RQ84_9FUNG|nr:hypothetical protein BGZ99_001906 [Dissophora globulifera]
METSASAASLRFLLLGDVGVGKSTFVNTFSSTLDAVHSGNPVEEYISVPLTTATSTPAAIRLSGFHIEAGPVLRKSSSGSAPFDDPLGLLPPKVEIPSRDLTFVTLPGYSSTTNPSTVLSMTDDYLNHHLHSVTSVFSPAIPSAQLAWFLIAGSRAHSLPTCAFYFVLYELKPIDILYMKMIHERVNLIPVITKADTLPKNELWVLKRRMLRQLKLNGIRIHTFGSDMDNIERMAQQRQWGAPPFVISTRRDGKGQLMESELKKLVDLCLYTRVRHLQEDAARKVIAWKQVHGAAENPARSNAEKAWSGRDVSTGGVANTTVENTKLVNGDVHNPYFAHIDTRPTEISTGNQLSPTKYAPPMQQQHFQQAAPTPTTATSQFTGQVTSPTTNMMFTPLPSAISASHVGSGASGYVTSPTSYAPPPSFTSGVSSGYPTLPPSLSSKPGPLHVSLAGYQPSPSSASATSAGVTGLISPPPSAHATPAAYVASTTYQPPPRTTSSGATQTRAAMMHTTSGLSVDGSTRPSELMDDKVNVHTADGAHDKRKSFMEHYAPGTENEGVSPPIGTSGAPEGNEVKVEIPNSGTSYQPSTSEPMTDLNATLAAAAQLQVQQSSFILPNGFQASAAFLLPPADLYQAAILPGNPIVAGTNEYGEVNSDIWEAAELGDVATVQMHLNNGVSPDQRNNSRSTLLHRTAWQGVKPYAVMKLLISYGANVNLTNENGNTVLQNVLMKHDDPALIKLLLDNGAQAMIPNREGMNTLEVAALFNKLESARYLLENDLSSSEMLSIANALQRARSPDKKAMKALLKSWQGKEGERRRYELLERQRGPQPPMQASDAASIRSFETTKGDGKSKWRKLKF